MHLLSRGLIVLALGATAITGGGYAAHAASDLAAARPTHTLNETINQRWHGSTIPLSIVLTVTGRNLSGKNGQDPAEGCTFNATGNAGTTAKLVLTFVSGGCTGTVTTFTGVFGVKAGKGHGDWTNTIGNKGEWRSGSGITPAAPAAGGAHPNAH